MVEAPVKILLIHNFYSQRGGEDAAVEAQEALLRNHGHEVITCYEASSGISSYPAARKAAVIPGAVCNRASARTVARLVDEHRPDIAHVHNVFPLLSPSVYRALHRKGVRIVQTVHNFRFLCPNGQFWIRGKPCERCRFGNTIHAIVKRCYRNSYAASALYATAIALHRAAGIFTLVDRFIALNGFSAAKLEEGGVAGKDRIVVLGNFLPEPWPEPGPAERDRRVAFLGRLSPEKGLPILITAMAELPDIQLKVAGDGPQAEALRRLARDLSADNVEFIGCSDDPRKWELLRGSAATVMPSACYEHFPLALLESLAAGTPVIAPKHGAFPHIIADGENSMLFEPGSVEDLREKIAWTAAHPREAGELGLSGRRLVETRFTAEAHHAALMDIYESVSR